jgi:hypothetical protein
MFPDGPASCYRTQDTPLGSSCWEPPWVSISGRGRLAPSGGCPGQGGRAGTFPDDPPGPASREIISRDPVEAEGGIGVRNYVPGSRFLPGRGGGSQEKED